MKKLRTKDTLIYMAQMLTFSLMELQDCEENNDFISGEKTAYVECLQWIQSWKDAKQIGLDYEIEKRFPLL